MALPLALAARVGRTPLHCDQVPFLKQAQSQPIYLGVPKDSKPHMNVVHNMQGNKMYVHNVSSHQEMFEQNQTNVNVS